MFLYEMFSPGRRRYSRAIPGRSPWPPSSRVLFSRCVFIIIGMSERASPDGLSFQVSVPARRVQTGPGHSYTIEYGVLTAGGLYGLFPVPEQIKEPV